MVDLAWRQEKYAAVTYLFPLSGQGPEITGQPQDWSGELGEYPDIRVTAAGEDLTYQWYYKDAGGEVWLERSDRDDCYDSYPLTSQRDGRRDYLNLI